MRYAVEDFIPHRDRMKLIDDIIEIDDTRCVTHAAASALWPLCDGKQINAIIIVELVAQTASAFVGWQKRATQKNAGAGVIVGIKKSSITVPFIPVGASLRTSCRMLVNLHDQYAEFEGEVRDDHTTYGYVHLQTFSAQTLLSGQNIPAS